jgi:GNAT superfamily N-acetyltransferase
MSIMHLTPELIGRAEHFQSRFHAARIGALAALPGNPYGVEVRFFGEGYGVACVAKHPLLRGKNRIHGLCPQDNRLLGDLLDPYRTEDLPCSVSVSVPHGQMTQELFLALSQARLWSAGSGTVPAIVPERVRSENSPEELLPRGLVIRRSEHSEKELYLDIFQQAFTPRSEAALEYRAIQWAEDTLPGGARYIAEIDGKPVGMASFPILEGVGYFGTGGILPEYRRHGIQAALIQCRLADASSLRCDLVLGGGSPGESTYRNFERAGLRLIPMGMTWVLASTS